MSRREGGKRDTNGLLSCSHTVLRGLAMHQGQIYYVNVAAYASRKPLTFNTSVSSAQKKKKNHISLQFNLLFGI